MTQNRLILSFLQASEEEVQLRKDTSIQSF